MTGKRFWFGIVALASFALAPCPGGAQQTNPEMMYFVQGEKYPCGLTDFQAFGLSRKAAKGGAARYSGWVMGDRSDPDGTTVDMAAVRVRGQRLTFSAKTRGGAVIAFDGRFLQKGDFQRFLGRDVVVVEGTARKLRGGRKQAEGRLRFVCGSGG